MNQNKIEDTYRKETPLFWALVSGFIVLTGIIFWDSLVQMEHIWSANEEYGHGYIIPVITAFLIWQQKDKIAKLEFSESWIGAGLIVFGLMLFYVGELSSIYTITQYAFVIVLISFALAVVGKKVFRVILVPLVMLLFMIPLPAFLLNNLSSQLQLISSKIGVAVIRMFDISVYLEGNVIDLGVYKLQVVEACSGLNYLFPLMTLAFISAYFFTGAMWKKVIIFLSSIPITIMMNSFRIGAIGVTVEYWGKEMAEGFLHDFEGWAVFMSCIAILVAEMWLLAKVGKHKLPLREAFGLDFPAPLPADANCVERKIPKTLYASLSIVAVVGSIVFLMPEHKEIYPDRKQFVEFPLEINEWRGRSGFLEQVYLDALKLSDYVINDYVRTTDGAEVNFYSAYYDSQTKGASAHSPRSCIPGGGWRITSHEEHIINESSVYGEPLRVNRLVIQKGQIKQLVYYWFQQRGRIVTNEYMMKWYLFVDSIQLHRTDGALIRITTILKPGQDLSIADERLESFVKEVDDIIPEYVPGT